MSVSRLAENASALFLASVGQKTISFFVFLLVARLAGAEVTGQYAYILAVTSLVSSVTDLGLTSILIRASAANAEAGARYLPRVLQAKRWLVPLACVLALVIGNEYLQLNALGLTLVLACGVMALDAFTLAFYGVIRGRQRLDREAVGLFTTQLVTALVMVVVLLVSPKPLGMMLALLAGSVWNLGWAFRSFRALEWQSTAHEYLPSWSALAREVAPFAIAGLCVKGYSYVDTIMIQAWHGAIEVAQYAVAYKATYALQFLPLTFVAALYPSMSAAYAANDREGLHTQFLAAWRFMVITGFPLAAGLSAFAPRVLPFLYGETYRMAIPVLSVLSWVLGPIFLDFPVGSLLNASQKAAQKTGAMLITLVTNVFLNALLVPRLGALGAAYAGVGSFTVLILAGVFFAKRELPPVTTIVWIAVKGLLTAALTWCVVRFSLDSLPLFVAVVLAGLIQLSLLAITRLVSWDDVEFFLAMIRRKRGLKSTV